MEETDLDLCTAREKPLCELSTSSELINPVTVPALKHSPAGTLLGLLGTRWRWRESDWKGEIKKWRLWGQELREQRDTQGLQGG